MIIDDHNDVDDTANNRIVDDAIVWVDVVMVRTTQSELVTLKIHVETSLLHPDFGLILEQILIFFVVDIDPSIVILHKLIFNF